MDPLLEPAPTLGRTRGPEPPREGASAGMTNFLALLRRWRGMLVAAAVTAGLVGYLVSSSGNPTYESRAVLLVGPISADLDTLRASGQLAQTYAQLATSRDVVNATERQLGLRGISSSISASANAVTRLLTIRVTDHDRGRGPRIANAHARQLIRAANVRRARTTAATTTGTTTGTTGTATTQGTGTAKPTATAPDPGQLEVVDPAEATSTPSGPGAVPIALVCALAGLLGALGLALLIDRSGDGLRGPDDVAGLTGAGVVGLLGRGAWRAGARGTVVERAPRSRAADEYRLLAAKLRAIGERSLLVLGVGREGEVVAPNLAAALTAGGSRVALLSLEGRHGTATLLSPGAAPEPLPPADLNDVVSADDAQHLLDDHLADVDVVIVHAPSIQQSSSGLVWARVVDGTLLVAQVDRTMRRDLSGTAESLRLVHARLLGTVLGAPPGLLRR
jgi:capsular polysaccharide biosynthesis protein